MDIVEKINRKNEFTIRDGINVGSIKLMVDDDGIIEVICDIEGQTYYWNIDEESDFLYTDEENCVIIYDMEAFKDNVSDKIKEAE